MREERTHPQVRVDAANTGPLDPEDYASVFTNIHDVLTDPKSGLEQLYASVKNATETK
jgi:hypothetical protein